MSVVRCRVGDVEVEYDDVGRGDDVFVLVHGFTGSRDDWSEQLPALAELGRTLAVDLRGHGGSTNTGTPDGYTITQLADDLRGFLDELGLDRVDLLGHSMGGAVALRLAVQQPHRLRSLVLMDTAATELHLMPPALLESTSATAREHGTGAIARAMRAHAASGNGQQPPALAELVEAMGFDRYWDRIQAKMDAMDPEAFATLGANIFDDVVDQLTAIACPTLVIVGEQDEAFIEPARTMHDAIDGARLEIIAGAAHSPQLERPDVWLELITEHITAARGGR